MKFSKVFKIFKKGAKAASKPEAKKGDVSQPAWPSGVRIGVYGHTNAGKTVYFTVLNEECKVSKKLQISITDNPTAAEFLANYRAIWGLGTSSEAGTMVDFRGEKAFPDPTVSDRLLQFTAILDRRTKVPIITYDYNGKAISISEKGELSEKVIDFMSGCDGILFFFDPKILGAELQTQANVASFVNMLERIAPIHRRLPIPIALVVTKSDILPGFSGEDQVVLISPEDEHFISEDFDLFLEKVLSSNKISSNPDWAGSVRNILVKLREFLRVVIGRTLNFQVFFVSNTGEVPEKVGTDVGRSIYIPPAKVRPTGVKEPFYWLLTSIIRNRRILKFRKLAKYAAVLSLIWILLYSIPFFYHFNLLLPKATKVENNVLKAYRGNPLSTTQSERTSIINAYRKYETRWLVRQLFPDFQLPARKIRETYKYFDLGKAVGRLDDLILQFSRIVRDSTNWPKINPSNDSLILNERHEKLIAGLGGLHVGDKSSVLFIRSGRTLTYWDLFTVYIASRNDTLASGSIIEQVQFDRANGKSISSAETQLGDALLGIAKTKKKVVAKKVDSRQAVAEFMSLKEKINNSTDPAFLLGKAVRDLKKVRGKLDASTDKEQILMINKYIKRVEKWSRRQELTYKIESIPDMGHLHIEVTEKGENPTWSIETQLLEGDEYQLKWKMGDDIHIAFDELKHKCQWGKIPSDKIVLKGRYSLFDMEGNILFNNIGKTISISFRPSLGDQLPKLR